MLALRLRSVCQMLMVRGVRDDSPCRWPGFLPRTRSVTFIQFRFIYTALNPNNSRLKAQMLSSCCTDFMCFKPATIWRRIKHFYKYMHQSLDTTEISQWLLRVGVVIDRNQSQWSVSWIKTQRLFCSCSSIVAFKPPHLLIHSCQSVSFPISFRQDLIFQTEQVMKY